jgi:hypothetical protein
MRLLGSCFLVMSGQTSLTDEEIQYLRTHHTVVGAARCQQLVNRESQAKTTYLAVYYKMQIRLTLWESAHNNKIDKSDPNNTKNLIKSLKDITLKSVSGGHSSKATPPGHHIN